MSPLLAITLGLMASAWAPAGAGARHLASTCAPAYGRCGAGPDYQGPTCCEAGSTCTPQVGNAFYSQCLPDGAPGAGSPLQPPMQPPMQGGTGPAAPPSNPLMDEELDFLTETMQRAPFNSLEFDLNKPSTTEKYGSLSVDLVNNNPVLATLPGDGVSQVLFSLRACAMVQPHSHSRGTEIAFVTKGQMVMGSLEETGRVISSTVLEGQNFVIPQGQLHFQLNPACEDAQFVASFPTRDPGLVRAAASFFGLPLNVQLASLGLKPDAEEVAGIKRIGEAALASGAFAVDTECLRRCGLSS